METARLVRRVTLAAVAAVPALFAAVVAAEAWLATRRHYLSAASIPPAEGDFGAGQPNPTATVRLVMLGDAHAAGVGVRGIAQTVGGVLASGLAASGYRVRLSNAAIAGSRSADLGPQVSRALLGQPDVAVLLIGADDALRAVPVQLMADYLADAVARLREAGVDVIVGTCPDLGAPRVFAQPLRTLLAVRGRQVSTAQSRTATAAGGIAVDLAAETGTVFRTDPGTFSVDGFHPSADGYRLWADALLPAVRHAVSSRAAL